MKKIALLTFIMAISLLLIFGDSKDNRLTVDQIGALYEIVELTECVSPVLADTGFLLRS